MLSFVVLLPEQLPCSGGSAKIWQQAIMSILQEEEMNYKIFFGGAGGADLEHVQTCNYHISL